MREEIVLLAVLGVIYRILFAFSKRKIVIEGVFDKLAYSPVGPKTYILLQDGRMIEAKGCLKTTIRSGANVRILESWGRCEIEEL